MVENRDGLSGRGINTRGERKVGEGLLIDVLECDSDLLPQHELRILLLILWPINPASAEARGPTVRIGDENAHLSTCKKL